MYNYNLDIDNLKWGWSLHKHSLLILSLQTFRFEYEIKYENNFSVPVCRLLLSQHLTSLIPGPFFSTGKHYEEWEPWKRYWVEIQKLYSYSILDPWSDLNDVILLVTSEALVSTWGQFC